jgi:hypothetical protein
MSCAVVFVLVLLVELHYTVQLHSTASAVPVLASHSTTASNAATTTAAATFPTTTTTTTATTATGHGECEQ